MVGRAHRPAARPPLEAVRPGGDDVRAGGRRQRTVEAAVVEGVVPVRRQTPWAGPTAWVPRVKTRWRRHARTVAHRAGALEQLSGVPVRRARRRP